MSRNLGERSCYFCDYPRMRLVETPQQKPPEVLGAYFDEFKYIEFANAECPACAAEYLAWCGGVRCYKGYDRDNPPRPDRFSKINRHGNAYSDLSFRSTFNDEPDEADMPKRKVRKAWVDDAGNIVAELPKGNDDE